MTSEAASFTDENAGSNAAAACSAGIAEASADGDSRNAPPNSTNAAAARRVVVAMRIVCLMGGRAGGGAASPL